MQPQSWMPRWVRHSASATSGYPPLLLILVLTLIVPLTSCTDSTAPTDPPPSDGTVQFDGEYGGSEFLLQRLTEPTPDGRFVQVDLVGKNVAYDDTGEGVSVDVAIRNSADRAGLRVNLYPRVMVSLRDFQPHGIFVLNADFVFAEVDDSLWVGPELPPGPIYAFDYSDSLGEDGFLSPGETSGFRTWQFRDVGQGPFSFRAEVMFSLEPDRPHVSGVVFTDLNRNGHLDNGEEGMRFGQVEMVRPDGSREIAETGETGEWSLAAREPGLYTLTYIPPPTASLLPVCLTTPNPLTVRLTPAPDGRARSFEQAHFGIDPEPCILPVAPPVSLLEDRPKPGQVPLDFYHLVDIGLRGDHLLRLRVGYSGCSDDHPLRLFAGSVFAETEMTQTWAVLSHDARGELCEVYFEKDLLFDLTPLRRAHAMQYGTPGPFDLVFEDHDGTAHWVRVP